MNFDDAIQAHSSWKLKLSTYLRKPDGSLNPASIRPDNKCALGQWLHGEGRKLAANPDYKKLVAEHARFHQCAAAVVDKANSGKSVVEDVAIGSRSDFGSASANVVALLMTMKKVAA